MQNMDQMPKGVMQPLIKPFDIDIDVPIITIALFKEKESSLSTIELTERIKDLQHKINGIENVAKTTLQGVTESG